MYSWVRYKQTGNWPPNIPNQVQDEDLKDIISNLVRESESKYESLSASQQNPTSSILPKDFNNFLDNFLDKFIPDNLFSIILDIFRPVAVGYLDDLIGQQLFIHILLFIVVISLIILLTIYLFIQIIVKNKDFIIKNFNNKFILFFIKYQLFLAKISSFVLPLLIMAGVILIFFGFFFFFLKESTFFFFFILYKFT